MTEKEGIAERRASRVVNCNGTQAGMKRGQTRIYVKLPEAMFAQIKTLALSTNSTISSEARALIAAGLAVRADEIRARNRCRIRAIAHREMPTWEKGVVRTVE